MGRQSSNLVDPFFPLHHQCVARILSWGAFSHPPSTPFGSMWSAVIARRIRIIAWRGVGVFRRQDNALAMALNELSNESLACAAGLEGRGVNKVYTCLPVGA